MHGPSNVKSRRARHAALLPALTVPLRQSGEVGLTGLTPRPSLNEHSALHSETHHISRTWLRAR
jgi:hypothetical protein